METLTPDVYIKEEALLSPSVAQVSTAVPIFIGHTEKAVRGFNTAVRINSLPEYRLYFGGPDLRQFQVTVGGIAPAYSFGLSVPVAGSDRGHHLFYALDHFFKNGGGDCYIMSIGAYNEVKTQEKFSAALALAAQEDEPTLIVLSEACSLGAVAYYGLCVDALTQCNELMDRFCLIDVLDTADNASVFKGLIGTRYLKYGAAYYPALVTSIGYQYRDEDVTVYPAPVLYSGTLGGLNVLYRAAAVPAGSLKAAIVLDEKAATPQFKVAANELSITVKTGTTAQAIVDAWEKFAGVRNEFKLEVATTKASSPKSFDAEVANELVISSEAVEARKLSEIKHTQTALYNAIRQRLSQEAVTLYPAAAVAGVYAAVDRERGVWKAPANVSLSAVIAPAVKIDAKAQGSLNIDPDSGKSINAIRSFTGKGTLIWGARTLAGNDNEWRYISVRRLFSMVEEATKKASYFAVFEPNDAATWLKVRGMLESYLYTLWQQGALAGPTPKAAYYVRVGLGTTMTTDDVNNGRMVIEIGLAAVRPAEFILLTFSHKLQEA